MITVEEFAKKHNMPEHIVKLFLEKFGINAENDTPINEEAVLMFMKPMLEEFKKQNPIIGKLDPTDICKS